MAKACESLNAFAPLFAGPENLVKALIMFELIQSNITYCKRSYYVLR